MAGKSSELEALMRWSASQCDGEWEHHHGVTIDTLDNPGWQVRIDTRGTVAPLGDMPRRETDLGSDSRWQVTWVENGVFNGVGAPGRLGDLLDEFQRLVAR